MTAASGGIRSPGAPPSGWPRCVEVPPGPVPYCDGVRFAPYDRCLQHLDSAQLRDALSRLAPGSDIDVRGTTFAERLLRAVVDAVRDPQGISVFGSVRFDSAVFAGAAPFTSAQFAGDARFDSARFWHDASFAAARFTADAVFDGALFKAGVTFRDAAVDGDAVFAGAEFSAGAALGPLTAAGRLILDEAAFSRPVTVQATAAAVSARGTSFSGATLLLRRAAVVIDGATSAAPLLIAAAPASASHGPPGPVPELASMHDVDASFVSLVNVSMAGCRFAGAYNLDQLRFEGSDCRFAGPPARLSTRPPFAVLHNSRRQVLAEEWDWRSRRRRFPWRVPPGQPRQPLEPERILSLYRQLRKAQEDAKNEPGAADFYYGEMEMRRHAATTAAGEKLVLALYWASSGYGLRATRALAALAVVLAAATIAFVTVGFAPSQVTEYVPALARHPGAAGTYQLVTANGPRPGWLDALFYSLNSSTSLLSVTQQEQLTGTGSVVQILLRLLGPLFVGLALLAIRNRVKR